jgi:hypothetical protein
MERTLTICIYCKENRKYIKFFKRETNHFDDGENESDTVTETEGDIYGKVRHYIYRIV